ncbi:MAG: ATP-binding protein [Acidobacteriota bacterium]
MQEKDRSLPELEAEVEMLRAALAGREEDLRQAHKMETMGRLLGGVAHDFNNMLSVILSFAEIVSCELRDRPDLEADVGEIRLAAQRAASLTQQLIAFGRRQPLDPRPVELNGIVVEMDKMLRRLIGEDVELHRALGPDLRRVRVDPVQIQQVLLNLAINARDAMPRGGAITIETANADVGAGPGGTASPPAGRYVSLCVHDTGAGIDPEVGSHLFEPFFTAKDAGPGTGLGLSAVSAIVRQCGGAIEVDSEPGRGSTFRILIPEDASPRCDARSASAPGPAPSDETILVVEDEDLVRRAATACLRHAGYRVLESRGPMEALKLLDGGATVDLVLSDVVMPRMGGEELARRIALRRAGLPVLFVSGRHAAPGRVGEEEAMEIVAKPFSPESLAAAVRKALDRARVRG